MPVFHVSFGDLMNVQIIFVWLSLLIGHLLVKSCSIGWSYVLSVSSLFVILVFIPFSVLGPSLGFVCPSIWSLLTLFTFHTEIM